MNISGLKVMYIKVITGLKTMTFEDRNAKCRGSESRENWEGTFQQRQSLHLPAVLRDCRNVSVAGWTMARIRQGGRQ